MCQGHWLSAWHSSQTSMLLFLGVTPGIASWAFHCVPNDRMYYTVCIFVASCRAFTITAAAQLCVLGTTWVFECFQFVEGTIATSYLFTIFGSLQGVMLFIIHCLFCKQVSHAPLENQEQALLLHLVKTLFVFWYKVREVYGNILFKFCAPLKSSYRSSATSAAKHM